MVLFNVLFYACLFLNAAITGIVPCSMGVRIKNAASMYWLQSCPYLKEKSLHHLIWLEFRFNKAIGSVLAFVNNIDLVRICV